LDSSGYLKWTACAQGPAPITRATVTDMLVFQPRLRLRFREAQLCIVVQRLDLSTIEDSFEGGC
jgi:hypothetical protein